MKKVSKRVSKEYEAYPAHGKKAPSPSQKVHGEVHPMKKMDFPHKKEVSGGSKKIEQASKETASMSPGGKMGKAPQKKDPRAAAAEAANKLGLKGINEGEKLEPKFHCGMSEKKDY